TICCFLLVIGLFFLGGSGPSGVSAQSDCGINVTSFPKDPREVTIDGVLYKRVQVVVNNPEPGILKKYYFTFDGAPRNDSTKTYTYGFQTEFFLVPVDVETITFFDLNSSSCQVTITPNFTPNVCTFN